MPRRPRVFVEGLSYHVYNRVGRGEAPFKLAEEAERFVGLIREVKERDGLRILAWCVMPNHYHLAVRSGSVPLWRSMRLLQHRYAQAFNRRCRVYGALWQARYKARPITDGRSILRLIAYIHLNPVAARMVDDPAAYRWSGHRELLQRQSASLIDSDAVYAFLGGTRRSAVRSYLSLLQRERAEPWQAGPVERVPWWGEEAEEGVLSGGVDALGASATPERRRLDARDIVQVAAGLLGVTIEELASTQRGSGQVEAREVLGSVAVERWGVGVKELAVVLGKSRDGVGLWVRRAAERRCRDREFAERLDAFDRALAGAARLARR